MRTLMLALAVLITVVELSAQTVGSKPNILMIVVDDLNDFQEYLLDGHPQATTPNLNKLARNGVTFQTATCSSPKSCPSRTSFMSGKDPDYTRVYNNENIQFIWRDNFQLFAKDTVVYSMPQLMKEGGYYTMGLNKIYFGWKNPLYDNDYDTITTDPCARGLSWNKNVIIAPEDLIAYTDEGIPGFIWAQLPDTLDELLFDHLVADTVVQFLDDYESNPGNFCNKPFFVQMGIFLPHKPLLVPEKFFRNDYIKNFGPTAWDIPFNYPIGTSPPNGVIMPPQPDPIWSDYYALPSIGGELAIGGNQSQTFDDYPDFLGLTTVLDPSLSAGENEFLISESIRSNAVMSYLAAVQYADEQIGRVLDKLEASTLNENTVVIFVSDHGYSLGEKRHWHKFAMFETDVRVPIIIKDPRKGTADKNVFAPVSTIDLFPTVLELGGIAAPTFPDGTDYLDGQSLVRFVDNPATTRNRPALSSLRKHKGDTQCFVQFSVRGEDYHYIKYRAPLGATSGTCDTTNADVQEELYHIGRFRTFDKNEWINLAEDPNYKHIKDYMSQWVADSTMFMQESPYTIKINADSMPCSFNMGEKIVMAYDLFDVSGTLTPLTVTGMQDRWYTSLEPNVYYTDALFKQRVSDLISVGDYATIKTMMVYVELVDTAGIIIAQDSRKVNLSPAFAPTLTFDVSVNGNELSVINPVYTDEELIVAYSWSFGDGTVVRDKIPAPYSYSMPGSYEIKGIAKYGSDTTTVCRNSFTRNATIDPIDFNDGICMAPRNLDVDEISPVKVRLTWTPVYAALSYQLRAHALTGPDTAWFYMNVPNNVFLAANLKMDLEYEFQVRTICDVALGFNSLSPWSYPAKFTTTQCYSPRGVTVDAITTSSATISWQNNDAAIGGYRLFYGAPGTSVTNIPVTGNSVTISLLSPDLTYYFKVRSLCDNPFSASFLQGPLSDLESFTTLPVSPKLFADPIQITVFPNPAKQHFQITWDATAATETEIRITDITGRLIEVRPYQEMEGLNSASFNCDDWAAGIYSVNLIRNGQVSSNKVIISND